MYLNEMTNVGTFFNSIFSRLHSSNIISVTVSTTCVSTIKLPGTRSYWHRAGKPLHSLHYGIFHPLANVSNKSLHNTFHSRQLIKNLIRIRFRAIFRTRLLSVVSITGMDSWKTGRKERQCLQQ